MVLQFPKNDVEDLQVTGQAVRLDTGKIKVSKSAGPDGIHQAYIRPMGDRWAGPSWKLYDKTAANAFATGLEKTGIVAIY